MSTLIDLGNCVEIENIKIPAVNIQVDGVPGFLSWTGPNGETTHWYGIYFEIMFESGALWVVEQLWDGAPDDKIKIKIYHNWAKGDDTTWTVIFADTWDEFLIDYQLSV